MARNDVAPHRRLTPLKVLFFALFTLFFVAQSVIASGNGDAAVPADSGVIVAKDFMLEVATAAGDITKREIMVRDPNAPEIEIDDEDTQLSISLQLHKDTSAVETPIRPHQAHLMVIGADSLKLQVGFVFKTTQSGSARISFMIKDLPDGIVRSEKGASLEAFFGTFGNIKPLAVRVADLKFSPELRSRRPPLEAKPLEPKPLIEYEYRPERREPSAVFPLAFSAVILVAGIFLNVQWIRLYLDIKQMKASFRAAPRSLPLFIASIVSLEILFWIYWIRLNIFQVLAIGAPIAAVAYFSGRTALANINKEKDE